MHRLVLRAVTNDGAAAPRGTAAKGRRRYISTCVPLQVMQRAWRSCFCHCAATCCRPLRERPPCRLPRSLRPTAGGRSLSRHRPPLRPTACGAMHLPDQSSPLGQRQPAAEAATGQRPAGARPPPSSLVFARPGVSEGRRMHNWDSLNSAGGPRWVIVSSPGRGQSVTEVVPLSCAWASSISHRYCYSGSSAGGSRVRTPAGRARLGYFCSTAAAALQQQVGATCTCQRSPCGGGISGTDSPAATAAAGTTPPPPCCRLRRRRCRCRFTVDHHVAPC